MAFEQVLGHTAALQHQLQGLRELQRRHAEGGEVRLARPGHGLELRIIGFSLAAQMGHDLVDLLLGDVGALAAFRNLRARVAVEHVAAALQGLGAHDVQDDLGIHA